MSGINVEDLDKLIKVNNFNCDMLSNDVKKLNVNIDELSDSYVGKDVDFVFSELLEQGTNLKKLTDTVKSYSTVLSSVKSSYQVQDAKFQSLLKRSSTR